MWYLESCSLMMRLWEKGENYYFTEFSLLALYNRQNTFATILHYSKFCRHFILYIYTIKMPAAVHSKLIRKYLNLHNIIYKRTFACCVCATRTLHLLLNKFYESWRSWLYAASSVLRYVRPLKDFSCLLKTI